MLCVSLILVRCVDRYVYDALLLHRARAAALVCLLYWPPGRPEITTPLSASKNRGIYRTGMVVLTIYINTNSSLLLQFSHQIEYDADGRLCSTTAVTYVCRMLIRYEKTWQVIFFVSSSVCLCVRMSCIISYVWLSPRRLCRKRPISSPRIQVIDYY